MSGLRVNEIVDFAILAIAQEERPSAGDLPGRLSRLSGGWFAPCADLVASRVDALESAGCLAATQAAPQRPQRRLRTTDAGREHLRALSGKAAPRPCAAAVLWHRLRLAMQDALPAEARSATLLDMAAADVGLPVMTPAMDALRPAAAR